MITKTAYLSYLHCAKRFWLEAHDPQEKEEPGVVAQRRMREGISVGRLARAWFPGGWTVPFQPEREEMARLTAEALAEGEQTLFEATFLANDLLIKADILRRADEGWHLIEVKGTNSVKNEHIDDVAFQLHVLQQTGIDPAQVGLMHLNRECRAPDLDNLFIREDVGAQVREQLPLVAQDVVEISRILDLPAAPAIDIGRHCFRPDKCPFYEHCWQGIDGLTIFKIPRLNAAKEQELRAMDVLYLSDIPDDFPLTDTQRNYVDFYVSDKIEIDRAAVREALNGLQYPLYFFDFETIGYAVPLYDGTVPHQQSPFQYSLHVLHEDGSLSHHEFLYSQTSDPRPELLQNLLRDIGPTGHIIVYNATFERTILKGLADFFPEQAAAIQGLIDRLWDQLVIFRKHYRHYAFGGSNSLKTVLPVVVPQLSYDNLGVTDGLMAQVVWEKMIALPYGPEKEQLTADLLAYCHLDTLAMVEIHHALARAANF